jgi:DNA-binding transcriptional LysR family regulator
VLPEFTLPAADLFVYYPSQRNQTIRARAFIDFLAEHFNGPRERQEDRKKGGGSSRP